MLLRGSRISLPPIQQHCQLSLEVTLIKASKLLPEKALERLARSSNVLVITQISNPAVEIIQTTQCK